MKNATLDTFANDDTEREDDGDDGDPDLDRERDQEPEPALDHELDPEPDPDASVTEAVVFDISAEFGHFRVPHAAPSAETYGLMPRTTVAGLLAGMLGLARDSYYDLFSAATSRIAVSVEAPIHRQTHGMNYLDARGSKTKTKGANVAKYIGGDPDPTAVSLLNRPSYRIYAGVAEPDVMNALDAVVRGADPDADGGRAPVYTPTLGKAQHLAWIEHVGRFPIEDHDHAAGDEQELDDDASESDTVAIRSAVPGDEIPLVAEPDRHYITERMTAYMTVDDDGRTPAGATTLTYTPSGKSVTLRRRAAAYATVGGDHVVFH